MGATTDTDIQSAFDVQLETLSVAGFSNSQIQFENTQFSPDLTQPWLQPIMILAPSSQAEVGDAGMNMQKGIYQINVNVPANAGWGLCLTITGALVELFKRGTVLS